MAVDKNYIKLGQIHAIMKKSEDKNNNDTMISKLPKIQESIEAILKTGFNINYGVPIDSLFSKCKPEFTGYTLLHFAVEYQSNEAVNLLLHYNPDITCKALNGFTPLRLAFEFMKNLRMTINCEYNNLYKIVNELLLAHIDLDIKTNPKCQNNISHFHIACMVDIKFANFFIEAGVDLNEVVHMNSPLFPGFLPLHFAIQYGHPELVSKLLQCGVCTNKVDDNGRTPLGLLVDCNMRINDVLREGTANCYKKSKLKLKMEYLKKTDQMMELLMDAIDTDFSNPDNDNGFTFLHASCTRQDQVYIKNLLKLGANINKPINFDAPLWPGYTPLHFAAHCNIDSVMLLLKKGANLAAKDANGITALDLCTERYTPTEISKILKTKALKCIRFGSKAKLADVFLAMDSITSFKNFLSTIEADACIPLHSPIWPGYTLLHLTVLMSQTKKKYNCKFFFLKNCLWDNNIEACSDFIFLSIMCLKKNYSWLFQNANGMTPMRLAFHLKKSKVFRDCLSTWAAKNSLIINEENLSFFHEVFAANCPELVEKLLKNGLDPNCILQNDQIWYSNDASQKVINLKAGSTFLHIATLVEANNVILECSKIGVEIGVLDADGLTPAQLGFLHLKSKQTLSNLLSIPIAQQINSTTSNNLTHLHIACYTGNVKAAEKLLQVVTNIDEPIVCDPSDLYAETLIKYAGYTPLHFAVECKSSKIVSLLIQKGANILRKNDKGLNSLHLALQIPKARKINRSIIKEAIKLENFQDDFGLTKLHLACFLNLKRQIGKLLKAGENVNSQINLESPIFPGDTPYHLLLKTTSQNTTVPDLLLQHGLDLSIKNADNLTPLHILLNNNSNKIFYCQGKIKADVLLHQDINKFCSTNSTNNEGLSLLHISACFCKIPYVERFLQSGADVNKPVDHFSNFWAGKTPLHLAAYAGNLELILLLLQYGADISAEDIDGKTVVHYLVLIYPHFTPDNIDDIISRNPIQFDFYNCDSFGKSVFEMFLKYGSDSIEILRWMWDKYNGDIDLFKPPFNMMLNFSENKLRSDVIRLLWEKKNYLTAEDTHGRNALFIMISSKFTHPSNLPSIAFECYLKICETLIYAGCELDHKDNDGKTALHQAVSLQSHLGVLLLLTIGADINIEDNAGNVPSYYVKREDFPKTINVMFQEHVSKMAYAGLYLNTSNRKFFSNFTRLGVPSGVQILSELNQMARTRILMSHHEDLYVRQLLDEQLVLNFYKFSMHKRRLISCALRSKNVVEKFPSWQGLFKLQQRRILARFVLLKSAAATFQAVTELPLLCSDIIVDYLSNEELKILIEAYVTYPLKQISKS